MLTLTSSLTILVFVNQVRADDFYTAAVVEYATPKTPSMSSDQVMLTNAATYTEYIANASNKLVDIIIFPEGGMCGHGNSHKYIELPPPGEGIAPCDNSSYHTALVMLSCAARKYKIYTVINLLEECSTERYNSNVVFDRNGVVVGRYRKFNPYGEPVTKPSEPDHHTFKTDFSVRFGMFTCFDIEFSEPAIVLARQYGVSHFIFPHCWISELPFLTAAQVQWGWAYSLDVVLLAAGCNQPEAGGSGSGVYRGRQGALTAFQSDSRTSNMLIARVPIAKPSDTSYSEYIVYSDPMHQQGSSDSWTYEFQSLDTQDGRIHEKEGDNSSRLTMLRDYLDVYNTLSVAADRTEKPSTTNSSFKFFTETVEKTLCQESLCCDFKINVTTVFSPAPSEASTRRGDDFSELHYRLGVFDGVRWYGGGLATGGVQVCGLFSCVNESISSCGLRADEPSIQQELFNGMYKIRTVFESIMISGKFANNTFAYPDIFVTGSSSNFGALLPSRQFTYASVDLHNNLQHCSLNTLEPIPSLITAAIYGRQFDRDGQPRTELPRSFGDKQSYSVLFSILLVYIIFQIVI